MNSRLRELRKTLNKSRAEFGSDIGVSGDVINNLERGRVELKDDRLKLICKEFNVNEDWLRNGNGEMFAKNTVDLSQFPKFNGLPPDEQKVLEDIMSTYLELDDISREALRVIIYKLADSRKE